MVDNDGKSGVSPAGDSGFSTKDVNWRLIGFIVVVVIGVIFFLQNGQRAEIEFLFYTKDAKTRWLVIVCIAIGVVADRLFSMWWRRRRERKTREDD